MTSSEMSLGIYGGSGTPTLYTMITTRTLNLLYFDGQGAALTYMGTLDTQMALLQNEVPTAPNESVVFDEEQRAKELCTLIKPLKLDGVARMNAGFEVLLCDYVVAGVEPLFSSNITIPDTQKREEDPTLSERPQSSSSVRIRQCLCTSK